MISPPGFLLDEHLRGPLWEAIQAHNASQVALSIRAYRVGDWPAPSLGTDDPDLLLWAERESCIIVSCDRQTMASYFWEHINSSRHLPGLILLPNVFSIPEVLEFLILSAHASEPDEWRDRIVYYSNDQNLMS
jgi:hypothetical protein